MTIIFASFALVSRSTHKYDLSQKVHGVETNQKDPNFTVNVSFSDSSGSHTNYPRRWSCRTQAELVEHLINSFSQT